MLRGLPSNFFKGGSKPKKIGEPLIQIIPDCHILSRNQFTLFLQYHFASLPT